MGIDNPVQIQTENAFAEQRRIDPRGHALHAWLGALWCALACGPMFLVELGWAPLAICWLIRLPRHARLHTYLGRRAAARCALAWTGWLGFSLLWTLDRSLGLEEFGVLRFALALPLLWPVMDRRGLLLAGLGAGMLAANVAQAVHGAGIAFDIPWLQFPRMPERDSGWWQPVVGGTLLIGALGLHLPAALTGRGPWRALGIFGALASAAGVLATGSRGSWMAAGALICAAIGWAAAGAWRRARSAEPGRPVLSWGHLPLALASTVVIAAAVWKTMGPSVVSRARSGIDEARRAVRDKDYDTDTGARILMARLALQAIEAHPLRGVGAGGYHRWAAQRVAEEGIDPATVRIHDHAHNSLLHAGATTGIPGMLLLSGLGAFSLIGGFRPYGRAPGMPDPDAHRPRGYGAGPAFAMLGLVLVSPFDVVQVNAQTSALLWIVVALCMRARPAHGA